MGGEGTLGPIPFIVQAEYMLNLYNLFTKFPRLTLKIKKPKFKIQR